jgi:hypothetical protein
MDGSNDIDPVKVVSNDFPKAETLATLSQFILWATSRVFSEGKEPGTWHWIEKV